jgi:hypothetical protein
LVVALVSSEPRTSPDRIEVIAADISEGIVLTCTGELSLRTVPQMRSTLQKHLADRGRVLVDLSGLTVSWAPALEVFPLALATAGGWPAARLVLFGTRSWTIPALHPAHGLSAAVHVADSLESAVAVLAVRPRRVSRRTTLTGEPDAARWARIITRGACDDWGITAGRRGADVAAGAEMAASELVTNAATHARTSMTLSLTLNDRGLSIAVRDYAPGGNVEIAPASDSRFGLVIVDGVSRRWGVTRHDDGKTVWALVPCDPGDLLGTP